MSLVVPFEEIFADLTGVLANHESWDRVELGQLCTILNGYPFKSTLFNRSHGFPIVRIRDLDRGSTETQFRGTVPRDYIVVNGDLLIGMDGIFRCCEWRGGEAGLNQRVCKITPDGRFLHPKFLRLALNGYLRAMQDATSSVTVGHLSSRDILRIPFPLPPISEQARIVAKLEELLSKVDTCSERLDRIPVLMKRFRQSVLAAACSGRLTVDLRGDEDRGGLPRGWEWRRVDSVFAVRTGGTPSRKIRANFEGGTIPWVKTGEVQNRDIAEAAEFITPLGVEKSNAKVFPVGTILIAMYGEGRTRGQVGRLLVPAATNQACAALVNAKLPRETNQYVFYYLLGQYYVLRAEAVGGNQPNLNLGVIKKWQIPLPPRTEQAAIVRRVEALFGVVDQIDARCVKARECVEPLTSSLLAKAFRGGLVRTEAELARAEGREFESAAALLERIRTEGAPQGGATRPSRARARRPASARRRA